MKISNLIENLSNVKSHHGDLTILLADPRNPRGAFDINRADIKLADMHKVLVLVPNAEGLTNNNAIIGGKNGQSS